ncbi:unnamed protein product [Rotaria sp. Silwood2]|nr:unnamed protein product [Rotaria sp. Silwood2]
MWFFIFTIVVFLYFFYRLLKFWIFDPWRIHKDLWAQGIPGQYKPIIGDVFAIRRAILADDPMSFNIEMTKKFGSYYHASFGPVARLVISDPLLIQGVLKTNARAYHKSTLMRLILGTLLGSENLLMSEDNIHAQHRRLIAPAFQHQNLNSMISLMIEITSNLLNKWSLAINNTNNKDNILIADIHKEMTGLTLDIVTGCVFGSGVMKDEHIRETIYEGVTKTLEHVEERTFNMIGIIPIINKLPLPSKRRIDRSKENVRHAVEHIINERKKGFTKSACKGPDLLDLLLSAHGNDKTSQLTDEELFEEALTFVLAGHETTATLMTWTLYNLANNPDICHRLESEIDSVLNDNEEITTSTLSLLTYTELVLKESLRLHQPAPSLVRTAIEDNTLIATDGKHIDIKKGTDILINLFILHHSEEYWNEPFKFDPSRFNERHLDTYLPFSMGPRSCIGQNFAMLEAKIMLAMIVKRFRFELIPAQKHVPDIAITMRMTDDYRDFSVSTLSSIDPIDIPLKNIDFESSLDSYSNVFDRVQHNFTASSEIPCIILNNEEVDKNPLPTVDHNRTFTKEISKPIINAFTGKPISPNPWRKLCTKNVQHHIDTDIVIPIETFPINSDIQQPIEDKMILQDQFNNKRVTRQSRRDMIRNQRAIDSSNDDDQAFEQCNFSSDLNHFFENIFEFLQEHRNLKVLEDEQNTPIRRRRKKRNNLKDFIDDSSSSSCSNENIKEHSLDVKKKVNLLIHNDPLWQRLADVYTSEESDGKNHLLTANTNLTIRLKSEIYTSDQSTQSSSPTSSSSSSIKTDHKLLMKEDDQKKNISFNFLQSLSECISFEDKHPDAKPYFIRSAFKLKEKRQELANKLLLLFNQDVFSSQLSDKVSVVWSGRLTATAGHCTTRRTTRTAVITLSHKVCDSPERCRDTLLHEMCHAAVTLIDGIMEHGHGPLWRQWTRMAERCYPYLPLVSVKHTYDIIYKFIYRCVQCQHQVYRHSKSLNLDIDFCGRCMGRFQLVINHNQNEIKQEKQTPKKTINKYNLFVQENFQTIKQTNPHLSTPQLMRQLSAEYKKRNQQQMIDLPDLDQLKI